MPAEAIWEMQKELDCHLLPLQDSMYSRQNVPTQLLAHETFRIAAIASDPVKMTLRQFPSCLAIFATLSFSSVSGALDLAFTTSGTGNLNPFSLPIVAAVTFVVQLLTRCCRKVTAVRMMHSRMQIRRGVLTIV